MWSLLGEGARKEALDFRQEVVVDRLGERDSVHDYIDGIPSNDGAAFTPSSTDGLEAPASLEKGPRGDERSSRLRIPSDKCS